MSIPNLLPNQLSDMINKVRRITGRNSPTMLSDNDIIRYINSYYIYDFPEHLRLENLRVNFQFTTTANIPAYDFNTSLYLTAMPPVYIGNYQSYLTQSRENFFRINPELLFLQQAVATGNGTNTGYSGTLTNLPILPGFKPNPPGAYSNSSLSGNDIAANRLNYNVIFSGLGTPNTTSGIAPSITVIDDGQGNLFDPNDVSTKASAARGTINYITGAFTISNFAAIIPSGNNINCQYSPYVASRPQSAIFYQDQILMYPIPDQAYTVSFEAYVYPTAFLAGNTTQTAQLNEWWQTLAVGASVKIFEDNGDFGNLAAYKQILQEYMMLVQRRTLVQQTSERTSTIYTEQTGAFGQFPFGNLFSGF